MSVTIKRALVLAGASEPREEQCAEHGRYLSRQFRLQHLMHWTGCPACAERRAQEATATELVRMQVERAANAQRKLEQRMAGAMIPPRFRHKGFDNYVAELPAQREALATLQAYADDFAQVLADGRCLLLVGRTGTGKTHLSAAVANHILRQGYTALFRTVQELIRHVRSAWGRAGRSEEEAIAELVEPDLLILDEVGVQYGKDGELVTLFDVMNARYSACKPSIVLSNLPLAEIEAFLGARVMDRLRENGGKALAFDWESRRANHG